MAQANWREAGGRIPDISMTYFPEAEVTAIIADTSKVIQGDIVWQPEDNVRGA